MTDISFRESNGRGTTIKTGEVTPGVVVPGVQLYAKDPTGNIVPVTADVDGNFVISIGAVTVSNVEISNDVGNPIPVSGAISSNSVVASATIARPADTTAYAALDVISNSTSAPTVLTFAGMARANGGTGTIVRARLMTDLKTCTARMRLHLFNTAPTAIADNSPYLLLYANAANRIGSIDFPALGTEDSTNSTAAAAMRPSYDGAYSAPQLWYKTKSDETALYGLLETLDTFTPASAQNFYIELGADGLS